MAGVQEPQASLLLFVATSSEEDAVYEAAKVRALTLTKTRHPSLGSYRRINEKVGDERVIVVRARGMGPLSRGGSADLALRFQWLTGATAIVQVGMAFGVVPQHDVQKYGDVLVSSSLVPYDNRDVVSDGAASYVVKYTRAARQPASTALLALFQREQQRGGHPYSVHVGAMLSGGARIHCRAFRDELVRAVPSGDDPIVGGEMEAVGLLGASDSPIWCVVKGIVDFADEDRDSVFEANRPVACRNAAEFVFNSLLNDAKP